MERSFDLDPTLVGSRVFDLSDHGKVEVAGKDAAAFLHNLCTNDIKRLAVGEGCEAFFTNAKARVLAYVWIEHATLADGRPVFQVDTERGLGATLFDHLNRYLISEEVELTDRSKELAELHLVSCAVDFAVQYREARETAEVFSAGLAEALTKVLGNSVHIRPHLRLGVPGFDLLFPAADKKNVLRILQRAFVFPSDRETFYLHRVEAGIPAHGNEIDDTRLVMELGRTAQAISYTKGCYLGQETIVMARDRGHVNRMLLGLKLAGNYPSAYPAKVFHGQEEVGEVTSSVFSPRVGSAIALAFLRRGHQQPGTAVEVESAEGKRAAEVAALPFSV